MKVACVFTVLSLAFVAAAPRAVAQSHPPGIASISVCSPAGAGGAGSCPPGTFDTHQIVLGPDGNSVNRSLGNATSDEHSSVFAPGTLNNNPDYLFFVASVTSVHADIGVVVLSGGAGPNQNGQWTMDFAKADGYGSYPAGYAQIFESPSGSHCPTIADGNPAHGDQTFDLNYAAPGSILLDPTSPAGNLLMIYEGTIICFGQTGGGRSSGFYSTVGVATSRDYGHTWPTYRGTSAFAFVPLPGQNTTQGPSMPFGAVGSATCMGNDCSSTPPASYGRYAVLSPSISVATAMATGQPLPSSMGDAEMAAFLDDAAGGAATYVYSTYDFNVGAAPLLDPQQTKTDLMIARAQLNGGAAPLKFFKWNGTAFGAAGIGGIDSSVFPTGPFQNCEAAGQGRFGSSISYVDETQQYLLTFVCDSPGDPASGQSGSSRGGAWFYSTSYDLSDPRQWTPPREIAGTWATYDTSGSCSSYKGWYPTWMSMGKKPGHLSSSGYVFYVWGCQTAGTPPPGRQYSSRAFTITVEGSGASIRHRAARH